MKFWKSTFLIEYQTFFSKNRQINCSKWLFENYNFVISRFRMYWKCSDRDGERIRFRFYRFAYIGVSYLLKILSPPGHEKSFAYIGISLLFLLYWKLNALSTVLNRLCNKKVPFITFKCDMVNEMKRWFTKEGVRERKENREKDCAKATRSEHKAFPNRVVPGCNHRHSIWKCLCLLGHAH